MDNPFGRQTVLIVDDMPENIDVLGQTLQDEYNVKVALNGENALETARSEQPPDLILLDIVMPGMDGYEVCRRLKADETTAAIPVIIVSSKDEAADEAKGLKLGAVDYLTKPVSPPIVKARVRTQLALYDQSRVLEAKVRERTGELAQANESLRAEVTQRVRAARALRAEKERAQLYLDVAGVMILGLDRDGRVTLANRRSLELLGYQDEELTGRDWIETCLPKRYRQQVHCVFAQLMEDNADPVEYNENPVLTRDGEERLIAWYNSVLRDAAGEIVGVLSSGEDITDRRRSKQLQDAVYRIAQAADRSNTLTELFPAVHAIIKDVMPAENFYIALYDTKDDLLSFPYFIDEMDVPSPPRKPGRGLTEYVMRSGEPLLCDSVVQRELERRGETKLVGTPASIWLGVPLVVESQTIGVMVVQHYTDANAYGEQDKTMLEFVSTQVATVIHRKRAHEELRRRAREQEALNAVITTATAASEVSEMLDIILEHTLRATGLEMGAIWIADQFATRGLPVEAGVSSRQTAMAAGLGLNAVQTVEDWQHVTADGPLSALAQIMNRSGIRASLSDSVMADGEPIGGISLASAEPRSWSADEIALVNAVGKQIGGAAERLQLLLRVRKIVDTVPEGVLLLDDNSRVILVNPVGSEYLGVLAAARKGDQLTHVGGCPLVELFEPPPEGLWHEVCWDDRTYEVVARPMETGRKNGEWVMVIREVTRQREIVQHVQRQERLAAVGQLAAGIAHDFNNIMAVIILYSQLASQSEELPPTLREPLEIISEQGYLAADLTQQILDFCRRTVLERVSMDLTPFLKEQVKLLERTVPEDIQIRLVHGPDRHTVSADPTRMQQVIMNLAVNARDAMPAGGDLLIELDRVQVHPHEESPLPEMGVGEWVEMAILDSGVGIPAEVLPRIFEPFFTTKEMGEGTGLGLAQVYGIVAQHEGHIDVASEAGKGTRFTIYLPALGDPRDKERETQELVLPRGRGETVLLVDDAPVVRQALVDSLQSLNYRALDAANGREALEVFREHADEIVLVISDLVMPGMSGEALLRALRAIKPTLKMVMMSGYPLDKAVENPRVLGLVEWLQKPVGFEQLAQVMARVFGAER